MIFFVFRATAMAFREDSKFHLVKGPARYSSQPFLPGELSSSSSQVDMKI